MRERDQEGFGAALLRETEQSGPPVRLSIKRASQPKKMSGA